MNDCNKCVWARRDGGCNSWDCTFIDQDEAANTYTDRLYKRVKESPVMVLRQPERKTGRWIRHPEQKNIYGGKCIECSECGEKYMVQYIEDEKFCRNCGADMRGEQDGKNT